MTMWQFFHEHWFIAWCALWLVWGVFWVAVHLLKLATESVKRIKEPEPIVVNDPKDQETIRQLREALMFLLKYTYKPQGFSPTFTSDLANHKKAVDNAITMIKETAREQSL